MSTEKRSYEITSGPSKGELFDACKYLSRGKSPIKVTFESILGYSMPKGDPGCAAMLQDILDVSILGIQHEDGSGASFNLIGYARPQYEKGTHRFEGYYNTKTRKGYFTFFFDK